MLMRIAMTLMVCGLIALGRGAVADEKATQAEIKQARKKLPTKPHKYYYDQNPDEPTKCHKLSPRKSQRYPGTASTTTGVQSEYVRSHRQS